MNRIARNISIILRAERMIAQQQLNALRKQTGLVLAAGAVAVIGVIMLNVAAYQALAETMSAANAALIVALVNLGLATFLGLLAARVGAATNTESVTELRDLAIDDLEQELTAVAEEARAVSDNVRRMARDPLGTIAPEAVGALAKALVKHLKD